MDMKDQAQAAIEALWDICDDGWYVSARADQWWYFGATCPHGEWSAESDGWDLVSGLTRLVERIGTEHP